MNLKIKVTMKNVSNKKMKNTSEIRSENIFAGVRKGVQQKNRLITKTKSSTVLEVASKRCLDL